MCSPAFGIVEICTIRPEVLERTRSYESYKINAILHSGKVTAYVILEMNKCESTNVSDFRILFSDEKIQEL